MKKIIAGIISAAMVLSPIFTINAYAEEKEFPSGTAYGDIASEIESFIEENKETTVGMEMTVYDRDGIIYSKNYGFTDRENGIAADDESVFEWGSTSKLLVWTSVMQLKERGLLDLEADIRNYLPDGFLKLKYDTPITMLDLMNHQAGFQEVYIGMQDNDESRIESLETTLKKYQPAQVFEPGTVTAYSNYGASLAALIVEKISGTDYAEYVHRNIFDVLGMEHTSASAALTDNLWVKEQRRKDSCYDGNGNLLPLDMLYISFYPAGSATGTISDMTKFAMAITPDPDKPSPLFSDPATLYEMCSPTSFYGDSGVSNWHHGLMENQLKVNIIGHGGNTFGQSAMIMFDPGSGVGMTVMTNQAHETIYNYKMYELIFGSFSDSEYAKIPRTIPAGLLKSSRGVFKGPLKIFGVVNFSAFGEEDMGSWWYQEGKTIYGGISDLTSDTAYIVFNAVIALLFVAAGIYSIVSLIASLIRKLRKKENSVPRLIITGCSAAALICTVIILAGAASGASNGYFGSQIKYEALALINLVSMIGICAGIVTAFVKKGKKPVLSVIMGIFMIAAIVCFDLFKFWCI